MTTLFPDRTVSGDVDPLDFQLDSLSTIPARTPSRFPWHRRLAIIWSTSSRPAVMLLLLGVSLGPQGLAVLTPGVLTLIDPAIPVALAALGVVVGLGIPTRRSGEGRLFAAATIEALVTGALVTAGCLYIAPAVTNASALQTWMMALAAGICASTSSALPSRDVSTRAPAMRVKDLDARLPIVVGAVMLAMLREASPEAGLALAAQAIGIALLIAIAGWLLLTGTSSDSEQRVFGVAAVLLVGGVADYLSLSALLSGVIAGAFWQAIGGATQESIRRDVGYVLHPLVVVLLLVAGASLEFSLDGLALGVAYVLFRTAGKLMGGWLASRVAGPALGGFGLDLTSPGIFGVAFAMNMVRAVGPDMTALLTVVVVGTVGSELVSALGPRRQASA